MYSAMTINEFRALMSSPKESALLVALRKLTTVRGPQNLVVHTSTDVGPTTIWSGWGY